MAIIMNGSPLFTGDAGSGESEIRRWILENDLLEALIALPEQLFYNTGIATYVWVLTNRKRPSGAARSSSSTPPRSGSCCARAWAPSAARCQFERKEDILRLLANFEDGATRKVEPGTARSARPSSAASIPPRTSASARSRFERPLRLDFQASPERIARLDAPALPLSSWPCRERRARPKPGTRKPAGKQQDRDPCLGYGACRISSFWIERSLKPNSARAAREADLKVGAPIRKAILSALSERNDVRGDLPGLETAVPSPIRSCATPRTCLYEKTIDEFFAREVKPHVPDAWIDTTRAGIRRTAKLDSSATRSTSTATSTSTARPARWRRSRLTSSRWRRRSWPCCGR